MEYIRVSPGERAEGQLQLLNTQIEILTITQRYKKFKDLRKKELTLKSEVRRKVTILQEDLKALEKNIPHIHYAKPVMEKPKQAASPKRDEFESEIDLLKRRIAQLNRSI